MVARRFIDGIGFIGLVDEGWVGLEGGNEPLWNGFIGHISLRHSSSLLVGAKLLLGMITLVTIQLIL